MIDKGQQGGRFMGLATGDEQRLHMTLPAGEGMHGQFGGIARNLNDTAWHQRNPQAGGDTGQDRIERAQLDAADKAGAASVQHFLETVPIGTAGPLDDDRQIHR